MSVLAIPQPIVSFFEKEAVRKTMPYVAITTALLGVCLIDKYMLLDANTNLPTVFIAGLVNTWALSYFHPQITTGWKKYWDEQRDKRTTTAPTLEQVIDAPRLRRKQEIQETFEAYLAAEKALETAAGDTKTAAQAKFTQAKEVEREIKELRIAGERLEREAASLRTKRDKLIALVMRALDKHPGFPEGTARIKLQLEELPQDETTDNIANVKRIIEEESDRVQDLHQVALGKVQTLQQEKARVERRLAELEKLIPAAKQALEENLAKKSTASLREQEKLSVLESLRQEKTDLKVADLKREYDEADRQCQETAKAAKRKKSELDAKKMYGETSTTTPGTLEERYATYASDELERMEAAFSRIMELGATSLPGEHESLLRHVGTLKGVIEAEKRELETKALRLFFEFIARLKKIEPDKESAKNPRLSWTSAQEKRDIEARYDALSDAIFQAKEEILGHFTEFSEHAHPPSEIGCEIEYPDWSTLKKSDTAVIKRQYSDLISGILKRHRLSTDLMRLFITAPTTTPIDVSFVNRTLERRSDLDRLLAFRDFEASWRTIHELEGSIEKAGQEKVIIGRVLPNKKREVESLQAQLKKLEAEASAALSRFETARALYFPAKATSERLERDIPAAELAYSQELRANESLDPAVEENQQNLQLLADEQKRLLSELNGSEGLSTTLPQKSQEERVLKTARQACEEALRYFDAQRNTGDVDVNEGLASISRKYRAAQEAVDRNASALDLKRASQPDDIDALNSAIVTSLTRKQTQSEVVRERAASHGKKVSESKEDEILTIRLRMIEKLIEKSNKAREYYAQKLGRISRDQPSAMPLLRFEYLKSQREALHLKIDVALAKANRTFYQFVHGDFDFLPKADLKRYEFFKHQLDRMNACERWRVLSCGADALNEDERGNEGHLFDTIDADLAILRQTTLPEMYKKEFRLLDDFYSDLLGSVHLSAGIKTRHRAKAVFDLVSLVLDQIETELSHHSSDQKPFRSFILLDKLQEYLGEKEADQKSSVWSFFGRATGVSAAVVESWIDPILKALSGALKQDTVNDRDHPSNPKLVNFYNQIDILTDVIRRKEAKIPPIRNICDLIRARIEVIRAKGSRPYKSDYGTHEVGWFDRYLADRKAYKERLLAAKIELENLEKQYYEQTPAYLRYRNEREDTERRQQEAEVAALRIRTEARADPIPGRYKTLSIETLSHLRPIVYLALGYLIYTKMNPPLLKLSLRVSMIVLTLSTVTHLFASVYFRNEPDIETTA